MIRSRNLVCPWPDRQVRARVLSDGSDAADSADRVAVTVTLRSPCSERRKRGKNARRYLSFIKSPCGSGLPMGDQRSERDRDDAGRAPASIWNSAHRKVSEKGDRVARLEAACDRIYAAAAQVYR